MEKVSRLIAQAERKLEREGARKVVKRTLGVAQDTFFRAKHNARNPHKPAFFDVAFINGCDYSVPHPIRYRVEHQIEQLESNGLSTVMIEAPDVTFRDAFKARSFVIFRCPSTPQIEELIAFAGVLNKKVYYDIDDLVIDTRYTDTIPYLEVLTPEQRAEYDDGVRRMGRTLRFCGSVITTTEGMARELGTLVPDVFVNRNTASEAMLYFSERALYERDMLPMLEEKDVPAADRQYRKWALKQHDARNKETCTIGFFSGSITHNDDFNMIMPALLSVLESRENVSLRVLGELDLPSELAPYQDRISSGGFIDWQRLPEEIANVDINIAPLAYSIFNEAKSENKWVEAALVKVPTVASDFGAFKQMIRHDETGVLCENTVSGWAEALLDLIDHPEKRVQIGQAAYDYCHEHCTTIKTGIHLANYIRSNQSKNIFFCLPTLNISGGVLVILKHCCILQDAGYDVAIVDASSTHEDDFFVYEDHVFPVYPMESKRNIDVKHLVKGRIDTGVATLFSTLELMRRYGNTGRVLYCVQNYETDFYPYTDALRIFANATYNVPDVTYFTISKWCQRWLKDHFEKEAQYAPNGIDAHAFYPVERSFGEGRIRILIEGDSESEYKNVDESFMVVDKLDPEKFEIWYLSYNGEPKDWYRYDKFLHKVPHEQMPDVYRQCDILLKTSILESFSYPPLEMMATGGFVVAIPNDGNSEYLVDEENCLLFEHGKIEDGAAQVTRIVDDASLRKRLHENGIQCANGRDWSGIEASILDLYSE